MRLPPRRRRRYRGLPQPGTRLRQGPSPVCCTLTTEYQHPRTRCGGISDRLKPSNLVLSGDDLLSHLRGTENRRGLPFETPERVVNDVDGSHDDEHRGISREMCVGNSRRPTRPRLRRQRGLTEVCGGNSTQEDQTPRGGPSSPRGGAQDLADEPQTDSQKDVETLVMTPEEFDEAIDAAAEAARESQSNPAMGIGDPGPGGTEHLPCGHDSFHPAEAPTPLFRAECEVCGESWVVTANHMRELPCIQESVETRYIPAGKVHWS